MSLSHISNKGHYAPQASLVDDRLYLTYALKKDVTSRITLTKFLDAVDGGKPGECQEFDFFKVKKGHKEGSRGAKPSFEA